ncbi:hypothetical protein ACQB6R_13705 [Propionibacteriaceae bacterium G1746]|uniref:hypothetical protein n=1 Tax=Aestuariimicrobium sp. G57 TaxID=3418485 RepID=UPI003C2A1C69
MSQWNGPGSPGGQWSAGQPGDAYDQQSWGQQGQNAQGWGQQGQNAQGWGQDATGSWSEQPSQWASTWAPSTGYQTPQAPKKANPLVPILVIVAVLAGGVGIWAVTQRGSGGGAKGVVNEFFDILNDQRPSGSQLNKIISGVGSSGVYEAARNKPSGAYTDIEVGAEQDGKVPVKFKHQDKQFTAELTVKKDGNDWKIERPFSEVTLQAQDRLRFELGDSGNTASARPQLFMPGVFTVVPKSSTGAAPWEPVKPTIEVPLAAGSVTLPIEAKMTVKAEKDAREKVVTSFNECLTNDDFTPSGCPFRATRPTDANYPAEVKWVANPSNAIDSAKLVDGTAPLTPCWRFEADMSYSYLTRDNTRRNSTATRLTITGCVSTEGYSDRVAWQGKR